MIVVLCMTAMSTRTGYSTQLHVSFDARHKQRHFSYSALTVRFLVTNYLFYYVGHGSSVGIATRHELDGPGIESRSGGEVFRTCPDRHWGPPSLLYKGYLVIPTGKAAGAWRWPPTPSRDEVKERAEVYFYSPSGSSWPARGWSAHPLF
jgi:hypothetical protein